MRSDLLSPSVQQWYDEITFNAEIRTVTFGKNIGKRIHRKWCRIFACTNCKFHKNNVKKMPSVLEYGENSFEFVDTYRVRVNPI